MMMIAIGNAVAGGTPRVSGPRMHVSNDDMLDAVIQSDAYAGILQETRSAGITDEDTRQLVLLLIANLRVSDGDSIEIKQQQLKALFLRCGLSARVAKNKIISGLVAAMQLHHADPLDNNYFRRSAASTRLDATHLSGDIYIKRDGLHEVLQGGQDALSVRIRTFIPTILRVVEAQRDRALRFEAEHRSLERERLGSQQTLRRAVQDAIPSMNMVTARGRVSRFNQTEYNALGFVDRTVPGFESASRALQSVAPQEQLAYRSNGQWGGISDNLTTVGKDAIRYMNSAAERDVRRSQADIMAVPTEAGKKRLLNNVLNERATRLKRFNVFHEDPAMVGVEGAPVDVHAQAVYYLNQEDDMRNFA